MTVKPLRQPDGSALCGQTCVAMAAGVSLKKAIEAVGHESSSGTNTKAVIRGLRNLGLSCADRCRRVSRTKPALPKRAIVCIHRPGRRKGHWMLAWDGEIHDPEGTWPDGYEHWRITSYLEIYED